MVSMVALSVVDCTKHAALRRKSKEWLARNQDNVSGMFIHGLLFQ